MATSVWQKYGIEVQWDSLKVLQRLPGNKIFFSLFSRMPGKAYDRLIYMMNSNPQPFVKIYVSIQLFMPFNQRFYLARRLKQQKIISKYRLDENGVSHVALSEETKSFQLDRMEQLHRYNIKIPPNLVNELESRKMTEKAWKKQ